MLSCLSLTRHFSCLSGVNTAKHVTVLQWKRIQAAGGDFLNPGALAGFLLQESSLPARSRGKGTSRVMQPGKTFEFLLDFFFPSSLALLCGYEFVLCGQCAEPTSVSQLRETSPAAFPCSRAKEACAAAASFTPAVLRMPLKACDPCKPNCTRLLCSANEHAQRGEALICTAGQWRCWALQLSAVTAPLFSLIAHQRVGNEMGKGM